MHLSLSLSLSAHSSLTVSLTLTLYLPPLPLSLSLIFMFCSASFSFFHGRAAAGGGAGDLLRRALGYLELRIVLLRLQSRDRREGGGRRGAGEAEWGALRRRRSILMIRVNPDSP